MTKQLLFYENAVPVSATRHADRCVETGAGYAFASHASAVPIMAVEFIAAASKYAIVFAPVGDDCQRLKELGVLKPTGVQLTAAGGQKIALGGFLVSNRKKLREIPDELELLHLHQYSLRNFAEMKDRLIDALPADVDGAAGTTTLQ